MICNKLAIQYYLLYKNPWRRSAIPSKKRWLESNDPIEVGFARKDSHHTAYTSDFICRIGIGSQPAVEPTIKFYS
jgi:hypothetical protein